MDSEKIDSVINYIQKGFFILLLIAVVGLAYYDVHSYKTVSLAVGIYIALLGGSEFAKLNLTEKK